jgi:hypothetical protein
MDNHSHDSLVHWTEAVALMRLGAACAAMLAILGGCALGPGAKSSKDVVAERAQEHWDLLVKNDFAGAYRYLSPGSKQVVTEQAYGSGFRRNFWTGAKVNEVQCPTEDSCEVDVTVEYRNRGLGMKSPVREKWVREKSEWWFVLER